MPATVVNVTDAKANFSSLLDQVGHGQEFVIAQAGRPVARLVPYSQRLEPRVPGAWLGRVQISADFDVLPADVGAAFHDDR